MPMDPNTAREILAAHAGKKPSEIGEAVDILYMEFGTYKAIAQQVGMSDKFWGRRHRLFQLPAGIRWKLDEGQIGIEQGYQISRLNNEEDQWLLAIAIIEAEDLTADECKNVVDRVVEENESIKEALSVSAGIRFDKTHPLLLPLPFDIWLEICKRAWERHENWGDSCYQLIRQGIDVDFQDVARQLEKLASELYKAGGNERKNNANQQENNGNQLEIHGL